MKLYFLRHAEALNGTNDDIRPLSPNGVVQCEGIGRHLRDRNVVFEAAFCSPLLRAKQTIERVLAECQPQLLAKEAESLRNDGPDFFAWLQSLHVTGNILLVGHNPSISQRASRLLGVNRTNTIHFSTATLVEIVTEDCRTGTFLSSVTPEEIQS